MRPATAEDLHDICRSLPETELGVTWGDVPTYVVPRGPKGRGFCLFRPVRRDALDPETGEPYDDIVVLRCGSREDRDALIEDESLPFFTIDHFRNHDTVAVLVRRSRLGEIDVEELREVVTEAWLAVAPRRLVRQHFPDL
jgi:hypothetical protein